MLPDFVSPFSSWCAALLEFFGVSIITVVALYSLALAGIRFAQKSKRHTVFHELRHVLGRGILLGLELLVAADIIYTVAVDLTFRSVGVLSIVVLIRTFLSFTLELEVDGRWPWQKGQS